MFLHTLAPDKPYAHDWFRNITKYAIDHHHVLPFLQDKGSEYVEEWLGDAMRELVLRVLNHDDKIEKDVRDELEKDLNEFMVSVGIDLQWTAQRKADKVVELSSVFTTEVAGMAAVWGPALARNAGVQRV